MRKLQRIKKAAKSRLIAACGVLGMKVQQKDLINVLARQCGLTASREAYEHLLSMLGDYPSTQKVALVIPDDMYKALSFIKRHIGNPELICLSVCTPPNNSYPVMKQPNVFFLKREFLFLAHSFLKSHDGTLLKHFENPMWLILSDGPISGGEAYTMDELDATCSDVLKTTVHGFGDTVFSVRSGTNDYQVVREIVNAYFPDISNWIKQDSRTERKRIIDLGGHIGSFSVQVNKLLEGNCDIHVYEPEPSNFELIEINLEQNHTTNITPFNLAVSSKPGKDFIAFNLENTGGNKLGSLGYETKTIPVEVVTLKSVFSKWDSMLIDILKIDVEGSEYDALFPAPELVKQCRFIVGEAHGSKEYVPQDMLDFLQGLGFSVTFSGDVQNLITFSAVNRNPDI